jgi:hypothetical protein
MLRHAMTVLAALLAIAPAHAALTDVVERIKPSVVAVGTFQKTRSPPFVFRGTGFAVGDGTLVATAAHAVSDLLEADPPETMMVLVSVPGVAGGSGARGEAGRCRPRSRCCAVAHRRDAAARCDARRVRGGQGRAVHRLHRLSDRQRTRFQYRHASGHRLVPASDCAREPRRPKAARQPRDPQRQGGSFRVFQLDATAYAGHSGSPVYDADTGDVIGVINITLKATKDAAVGQATGISFAVPIQYLQDLIRGLR